MEQKILTDVTLGVVNFVLLALGGLVGTAVRRWLRRHSQDEIVLIIGKAVKWAEEKWPEAKQGQTKHKMVEEFILAHYPWMKKYWPLVQVLIKAAVKEMRGAAAVTK